MTDYIEKSQSKTTTTILLLPAVGTSRRSLMKYGFINGYIADKHHEVQYEDAVYILFKPESWEKFEHHVKREQDQAPNLISQYDYAGGYIVLVYSLLDKWKDVLPLFKEGKYSKFSKEYQDCFPPWTRVMDKKTGVMSDELSLQYLIFEKGDPLKEMWEKELGVKFTELGPDMEVWGKPNLEKETLDIEQIRTIKPKDNEQNETVYIPKSEGDKAGLSEDV